RVVSDHISDLLLAPTPTAVENLIREGLGEKTAPTGDIMYDTVLYSVELAARKSKVLEEMGLKRNGYILATVHRAENTDSAENLGRLLDMFNEIAAEGTDIVFPVHPRTSNLLPKILPDWSAHPRLHLVKPVGYLDMMQLLEASRLVLTDSGGLQKEAFFLQRPCITVREETEWVETVLAGGNVITGPNPDKIRQALKDWEARIEAGDTDFGDAIRTYFGDGKSAAQILELIVDFLEKKQAAEVVNA
ncbi:MAG: UDP-N-acetylglucosamine 2-epimerase (non-hydrolyzing), partial [Bacteroidetes bacterium]